MFWIFYLVLLAPVVYIAYTYWKEWNVDRALVTKSFFEGKTVLITGASMGVGAGLAEKLAAYKCNKLKEVGTKCEKLGSSICIVQCDVTEKDQCQRVVDEAIKKFNKIDVLILDAGISGTQLFEDMKDLSLVEKMMDVNFWGYINFVHAALPHLKKSRGSIGVMSSVSGLVGVPYRTAYCASKFAVMGFFNALRYEIKDQVKVTLLCPGWIDSGLNSRHIIEQQKHYSGSKMSVEKAVEIILYSIASGKRQEGFVLKNKVAPFLQAVFPQIVDFIVNSHVK